MEGFFLLPLCVSSVILVFQRSFLDAVLFLIFNVLLLLRCAMQVRVQGRWPPHRAILKQPEVLCPPFSRRISLSVTN